MGFGLGLIFIVIIGYILIRLVNGKSLDEMFRLGAYSTNQRHESLQIIEERYARGEISREEFLKLKQDLTQ